MVPGASLFGAFAEPTVQRPFFEEIADVQVVQSAIHIALTADRMIALTGGSNPQKIAERIQAAKAASYVHSAATDHGGGGELALDAPAGSPDYWASHPPG